MESGLV